MVDLVAHVAREARRLPASALVAPIVVAVSGGADSIALLHALAAWARRESIQLHAAHVDHGLRDPASRARDRAAVEELCAAIGVQLSAVRVHLPRGDFPGVSGGENGARAARYRALAEIAARDGARTIALAHHADDQAETVLLHLLRGTGAAGLRGIWPLRTATVALAGSGEPLLLWRPLLGVRRADVEAYRARHQLSYSEDASNDDDRFTRNRLRHTVVPRLEQAVRGAVASIGRAADITATEDDFLHQLTELAWARLATRHAGYTALRRATLREEHPALQRRLVRRAWQATAGDLTGLSLSHTEGVRLQVIGEVSGGRLDLPRGHQLVIDYDWAYLGRRDTLIAALQRAFPAPLVPAGWSSVLDRADATTIALPDGRYTITLESALPGERDADDRGITVPGGPDLTLQLRTRRPGDIVRVPSGHHRLFQDWCTDHHVSSYVRDKLVLLAQDRLILWVAGVASYPPPPRPGADACRVLALWYDGQPLPAAGAGKHGR